MYIHVCRIVWLAIFFILAAIPALPQNKEEQKGYYRFNILYYHPDSFNYENSYYLKEKDFWSFQYPEFRGFAGGMIEDSSRLFGKLSSPSGLGIRFKKEKSGSFGYPVRVLSRKYSSYNVLDTSAVSVIALGINPSNASQYEYRLILNDQVPVKDWTDFSGFRQVPQTGYKYAVLGEYIYPGSYLLIEIRNKQTQLDAGSMVINWPKDPGLSLLHTRVYFKEDNAIGSNGYFDASLLQKRYSSGKDSISGVLQDLRLPGNKEYLSFIVDFRQVEITFPYKAILERKLNDKTDTVEINFYFNEPELRVGGDLISQPGKYRLLVGNTYFFESPVYDKWILKVPFEILRPSLFSKKWTIRQALPYLAAVIIILILLLYTYNRVNKRKLERIERDKQVKQLQLRSLQHQLNPHFLFNALSAIQNLVGKKELEPASRYLDRFSSLTRTILATSSQELISLEDELHMLQAYLEMEQLRVPFEFSIDIEDDINVANTDIPGMLLQPFVENAVKHGVSVRKEGGLIRVSIQKEAEGLTFTVQDNGPGMPSSQRETSGVGLSIVARRVKLLNEMYGESLIGYTIHSDVTGTGVVISLENWFN